MISSGVLEVDVSSVTQKITSFISEKINASGLKRAIVAVSGGIDSALTLALTVKAIGGVNVRAITLPECDITPEEDVEDVIRLTKMLNVTCDVVEITPVIDVMHSILPLHDKFELVSSGNIKSRVRMTVVYHYANVEHRIVVGSSNKTEWLTGYFTKYGDGGVDLMPIVCLYKTQVRQLARYLDIPKKIIDKTPSAGFWPGQSDEDELGIKYEVLDLILYLWERGMDFEDIAESLDINPRTVEQILDRVKLNEHKRRLPLFLRHSSDTG